MMDNKKKAKIESGALTTLIMALILLLLWYVSIDAPRETEEEGVEVAFGDNENGGGSEPDVIPMPAEPVTQAPPPTPQAPSDNDLVVQDDEESLALAKQREEERKRKAEQEELIRKQREEQEAREREAEEKRKADEEAKRKAQEKAQGLVGSLNFGNGQQGAQGSGTTQGASQQGSNNPVGKGNFGSNNSWSLAGRSLRHESEPDNDFNQEGIVVVDIQVDGEGKVISTKVGEGSTVSDSKTQRIAMDAARKLVFSPSEQKLQFGKITYRFTHN